MLVSIHQYCFSKIALRFKPVQGSSCHGITGADIASDCVRVEVAAMHREFDYIHDHPNPSNAMTAQQPDLIKGFIASKCGPDMACICESQTFGLLLIAGTKANCDTASANSNEFLSPGPEEVIIGLGSELTLFNSGHGNDHKYVSNVE